MHTPASIGGYNVFRMGIPPLTTDQITWATGENPTIVLDVASHGLRVRIVPAFANLAVVLPREEPSIVKDLEVIPDPSVEPHLQRHLRAMGIHVRETTAAERLEWIDKGILYDDLEFPMSRPKPTDKDYTISAGRLQHSLAAKAVRQYQDLFLNQEDAYDVETVRKCLQEALDRYSTIAGGKPRFDPGDFEEYVKQPEEQAARRTIEGIRSLFKTIRLLALTDIKFMICRNTVLRFDLNCNGQSLTVDEVDSLFQSSCRQ